MASLTCPLKLHIKKFINRIIALKYTIIKFLKSDCTIFERNISMLNCLLCVFWTHVNIYYNLNIGLDHPMSLAQIVGYCIIYAGLLATTFFV
jgi:hypothetical protein